MKDLKVCFYTVATVLCVLIFFLYRGCSKFEQNFIDIGAVMLMFIMLPYIVSFQLNSVLKEIPKSKYKKDYMNKKLLKGVKKNG